MLTIKNHLNSPQSIHTSEGIHILAAMGEMTCEALDPIYGPLYRQSQFLTITEGKAVDIKEVAPAEQRPTVEQNEDEDGELDKLRAEYEELIGRKPHHKMKAETLQEAIDKALAE